MKIIRNVIVFQECVMQTWWDLNFVQSPTSLQPPLNRYRLPWRNKVLLWERYFMYFRRKKQTKYKYNNKPIESRIIFFFLYIELNDRFYSLSRIINFLLTKSRKCSWFYLYFFYIFIVPYYFINYFKFSIEIYN